MQDEDENIEATSRYNVDENKEAIGGYNVDAGDGINGGKRRKNRKSRA